MYTGWSIRCLFSIGIHGYAAWRWCEHGLIHRLQIKHCILSSWNFSSPFHVLGSLAHAYNEVRLLKGGTLLQRYTIKGYIFPVHMATILNMYMRLYPPPLPPPLPLSPPPQKKKKKKKIKKIYWLQSLIHNDAGVNYVPYFTISLFGGIIVNT